MKTMLSVPFAEKDEARQLGARWDLARKCWYVEDVEDMKPFLKWIAARLKKPSSKPAKKAKHVRPASKSRA